MKPKQKEALELFKRHWRSVGFVSEEQLQEYSLYTETREGSVIGAVLADHVPDVTLVHAIAVDAKHQRSGVGTTLIQQVAADSPNEQLEAKADVDSDATAFYESTGWQLKRTTCDDEMNVWVKPVD